MFTWRGTEGVGGLGLQSSHWALASSLSTCHFFNCNTVEATSAPPILSLSFLFLQQELWRLTVGTQ